MSERLDVTQLSEPELIEIATTLPSAIEPLGELALAEYLKRRGKVINRALEEAR